MSEQPQVPHGSTDWCISAFALKRWRENGLMLQKAHRVLEVTAGNDWLYHIPGQKYHRPFCGPNPDHMVKDCVSAPEGWPACRQCSRTSRKPLAVPKAFEVCDVD